MGSTLGFFLRTISVLLLRIHIGRIPIEHHVYDAPLDEANSWVLHYVKSPKFWPKTFHRTAETITIRNCYVHMRWITSINPLADVIYFF